MNTPVIVVHGGAGKIASALRGPAKQGVATAATVGLAVMTSGGDATAAVLAAVASLEDDPSFNAAHGACMNAAGQFELDAGMMVASDRVDPPRHGAVAAVPNLRNPLAMAHAVMEHSPHALLVASGAVAFAEQWGGRFDREGLWTAKADARWKAARAGRGDVYGQADTVGAVALDAHGQLCVGCSTGGVLLKAPGRVGDSPLVGAGYFASRGLGAACATGMGEAIMTRVVSYAVLSRIAAGEDPQGAATDVCALAAGRNATCGLILVLPDGRVALAHHSPHMSWAVARDGAAVDAGIVLHGE